MPLYEYECERCGHRFEVIQKFSDPLADTCPVCGGPVRKLMSSPAIQFKGSGFYITDYPKKDSGAPKSETGKSEKSDAGDKPAAETKTGTASDTKSSKESKESKESKGSKSTSDKSASTTKKT
jgi:putative FmdB family regulatory protein